MFKPETKTKAAAVAAFLASGAAIGALEGLDLSGLRSWRAASAGAAATSALTLLVAYRTKHAAEALSWSAREAAERLRDRAKTVTRGPLD